MLNSKIKREARVSVKYFRIIRMSYHNKEFHLHLTNRKATTTNKTRKSFQPFFKQYSKCVLQIRASPQTVTGMQRHNDFMPLCKPMHCYLHQESLMKNMSAEIGIMHTDINEFSKKLEELNEGVVY